MCVTCCIHFKYLTAFYYANASDLLNIILFCTFEEQTIVTVLLFLFTVQTWKLEPILFLFYHSSVLAQKVEHLSLINAD